MQQQQQKPMPIGIIVGGLLFFGMAWLWESLMGGGGPNQFYIGFFQFMGVMAFVSGGVAQYKRWRVKENRRAAAQTTGKLGTADFATLTQCKEAGLTDPHGLYLGLLKGTPLFYNGKAHLLTVAPARQGKGTNVVIPNLLHFQGSVFVTDPKGELAAVTAKHRRETFGQQICILNPWGLHGLPQHRYNPLQVLLDASSDPWLSRELPDEAEALTLQLYPEPEDQKNKFFRDGSRKILTALMLHLATRGEPESCTLPVMWRTLNNEARMKAIIEEMTASRYLRGIVADYGSDLKSRMETNPDLFGDFQSGASQAVNLFKPDSPLGDAVSGSDVDFRNLKEGRLSIYLIIDANRVGTHGAWLGLIARQAITAVARSTGPTKVLFLMDEFANMGKLSSLAEALTALPGLGVRVWAVVQELADIKRIYGEHTHETLLSQAEVKQFFAVTNHNLARILSEAMGQKTVKTSTYNMGRTEDDEVGESLGEQGVPLMRPEDIRQMGRNEQLLFITNLPPVHANRMDFWHVSPWQEQAETNPVEGEYPRPKPQIVLGYRKKGG